jgi:hypothetical protein
MNPLDTQVEAVVSMLRAAGGVVGIDPDAPDFVKMAFLDAILSCPDCRSVIMGGHNAKHN